MKVRESSGDLETSPDKVLRDGKTAGCAFLGLLERCFQGRLVLIILFEITGLARITPCHVTPVVAGVDYTHDCSLGSNSEFGCTCRQEWLKCFQAEASPTVMHALS